VCTACVWLTLWRWACSCLTCCTHSCTGEQYGS
jgi:hypothetical protein